MIYKEHLIELFVNGEKVELESQKSLNLRFNNVLYDPEKIVSNQGEYSFEFEIPSTPKNDRIFDYANNLSKLNKFHQRWNAEVYADGTIIFEGSLTLNGYKDRMYKCNLVSIKTYSFEDIFGDDVLTDIPWEIPFEGGGNNNYTIDYYNSMIEPDVVFPLVSYGAFQKSPVAKDSVGNNYTSKYDLDKYNRWYIESFYPSLNMLKTVKKAFEYKGYTVTGDAFKNVFLKDIFMSCNLADGQTPDYNLGNPKFGKVDLTVQWTNPLDTAGTIITSGTTYGTTQELNFPYMRASAYVVDLSQGSGATTVREPEYNFTEIRAYDMLSASDGGSVTLNQSASYMYQPNEHLIVIPADGFYKIEISASTQLLTTTSLTASQLVHEQFSDFEVMSNTVHEEDITFNPDYKITTPLEIQLVRNYDNNIELIKGKNNFRCHDGYPDNETELNFGKTTNYSNWSTCFPHEKLGMNMGWFIVTENPTKAAYGMEREMYESDSVFGYFPYDGDIFCYDPVVNPDFICGWTTMGNKTGNGCGAVIKNGYSWSKLHADKHDAFYPQPGYEIGEFTETSISGEYSYMHSNHNKNVYPESPANYFYQNGNTMNGRICCMVYLKKNDVLQLYGIHRNYNKMDGSSVTYQTSATVNLKIEAASPNSYANLFAKGYGYNSNPEFSYDLRVTNFLNKEKKISEWIQNIIDAYNLEVIQDGNNVFINTKKKFIRNIPVAVDIDDRVNSADAEVGRINYPKSMAVKYKIDTDEWGFEQSVTPKEKLNDPDWKDYGDSGFTEITLSDDIYETGKSDKNLQFSYTWYDNFNWYPVNSSFEQEEGDPTTLTIPVISKFTYMIDGYDYEESMKHDGYGQPQRFWFKPRATTSYVYTRTYPAERIQIYEPKNLWTNYRDVYLNLSYKTTEPSLLTEYFNITPYLASNYVTVEAYLSPEEYKAIKNGCSIHFDSDIYIPVEVNGYDPSGNNTTEIKMIKKI